MAGGGPWIFAGPDVSHDGRDQQLAKPGEPRALSDGKYT